MRFWQLIIGLLIVSLGVAQKMPQLVLINQPSQDLQPIEFSKLKIDIKVTGNLATTTMDITYFNPNRRRLEGKFYFPLNRGQTVSRFALDVNGHLREGVVVEKTRAVQIFEDVERRRIDPGLLEMVPGNNFKARIYPIPAYGYKRLVIAYEQELEETEEGYLYRLPLQFEERVSEFSIHIDVFKQKIKPQLFQSELNQIEFKNWHESYQADFEKKDYLPNQSLSFVVPQFESNRQFVYASPDDEHNYFYVQLTPAIRPAKRALPHNLVLFWDASSSAEKRDIQKEIAVLDAYFKKIKNGRLKIVTFNYRILEEKDFNIRNGEWQGAKQYLNALQYDGGTQLGALNLNKYQAEEFILCSDGLSNIGSEYIKPSKTPLIVINSSPNGNHAYLQQLANQNGGRYLDLNSLSIDQVRRLLLQKPLLFMKAKIEKGKVKDLLPSQAQEVTNQFSLAGQLLTNEAIINLQFGDGQKVLFSKRITISKNKDLIDDPIIWRIWAQKKLYELSVHLKENEQKFVQLAKDYGIVTPFTSLLVLDRIEDYLHYRVVPPERELRETYFTRLQKIEKRKKRKEESHLEQVVKMFEKRLLWWQGKLKKEEEKRAARSAEPGTLLAQPSEIMEDLRVERDEARAAVEQSRISERISDGGVLSILSAGEEHVDHVDHAFQVDQVNHIIGSESILRLAKPVERIKVKKWDPETPYLKALKKSQANEQFKTYLTFKQGYANSPAFFFDVADFFVDQGKTELALQVLTNLAEMELENHELMRMLAYRLLQIKQYQLAIGLLRRVVQLRPFEPQSYRDLALTLEQTGEYQEAVDLLYKVATSSWNGRFPEIELIALEEMNNIIALHGEHLNLKKIDKRLIKNLPVDLRVVMTWEADNTDIDLWVFDPNNEKCYYKNRYTDIGGFLSRDFTRGYGSEEFLLRKAPKGTYKVKAHFYGNHRQILSSSVTVFVDIFTHYGTKQQTKKSMHLRLRSQNDLQDIGEVEIQ